MHAPITHVLPITTIRRERLLPVGGRVLVRRAQQVNPYDVIAEAVLSPEHLLLEVARGLDLPPKEADRYIQRASGEEVGEGDILAGPVGVGRRVVRAPKAGKIVVAGDGQVLLQLDTQPFELRAGYAGVVVDQIGERGVIIETTGALVQCVWGNGLVNYGLLNPLARTPDEALTSAQLDVSLRGSVVMGGYCEDENVLRAADELPLRGLILASMDSALVPVAQSVKYPIVLIDGFGKLSMNPAAYKLLSTSARRDVALNAESWNRITNIRPEIVIALTSQTTPELTIDMTPFAVGQTVRVVSPLHKGQVGTLATLPDGVGLLPSGIRAKVGEVRFESGEIVAIPLANLEIVE